jgi:hypothetical protein
MEIQTREAMPKKIWECDSTYLGYFFPDTKQVVSLREKKELIQPMYLEVENILSGNLDIAKFELFKGKANAKFNMDDKIDSFIRENSLSLVDVIRNIKDRGGMIMQLFFGLY